MPTVTRLLAGQGTTFEDAFLTTPLCCPSRAGLLTGQYGHNNGVLTSSYGYLRDKGNVLPVWLRRAAYYDWDLSRNGRRVHYGSAPRDYAPRVFERSAARLVRRFAPRRKPIFLEVDEIAPHPRLHGKGTRCGAVPDPRDIGKFGDASLPQPPSFNEADVSDKPSFLAHQRRLTDGEVRRQTARYRSVSPPSRRSTERWAASMASSEISESSVGPCSSSTRTTGSSWRAPDRGRKLYPYEEADRGPLYIRLPPRYRGPRVAQVSSRSQISTSHPRCWPWPMPDRVARRGAAG